MTDEKKARKALGDLLSDADLSDDAIADDIRSFGIDPQAAKGRLWAKTQVLIASADTGHQSIGRPETLDLSAEFTLRLR